MANNKTRWEADDPPNTLLAIDPGASYPKIKLPYAGAALFQWGMLVWAGLIKCPTVVDNRLVHPFSRPNELVRKVCESANIPRHGGTRNDVGGKKCSRCGRGGGANLGEQLTALVVENPLIYKKGHARPKDIVALSKIYGAFMGGIDAEFYYGPAPGEWKGSIDGGIFLERVVTILNAGEQVILVDGQAAGLGGLSEHTIDAVGLGLFTLGRCGVAGVV